MAKKIGVILSGCGVYDGSEIHETVITLLAIDRAGAKAGNKGFDVAMAAIEMAQTRRALAAHLAEG